MWPESTGGQTGANIEIAGFPGGGDAPYFTTQLMGSPLYGMPTLSFFETTSIFRLDDTDPVGRDPARRPVGRVRGRPDGRYGELSC